MLQKGCVSVPRWFLFFSETINWLDMVVTTFRPSTVGSRGWQVRAQSGQLNEMLSQNKK